MLPNFFTLLVDFSERTEIQDYLSAFILNSTDLFWIWLYVLWHQEAAIHQLKQYF
jgi:hypothetical protein